MIHFVSKEFYEFQQIQFYFWIGNLLKLDPLEFDPFDFYIEDILTKLFQFIDWH